MGTEASSLSFPLLDGGGNQWQEEEGGGNPGNTDVDTGIHGKKRRADIGLIRRWSLNTKIQRRVAASHYLNGQIRGVGCFSPVLWETESRWGSWEFMKKGASQLLFRYSACTTIRWYLAVFNDSDQRSFSVSGVGQNSVSTFSTRGPSRWPWCFRRTYAYWSDLKCIYSFVPTY